MHGGGLYRGKKLSQWRNHLMRERQKRKAAFAELIAEGYTITAASRTLGFSQQLGSSLMAEIRQDMGEE